MKNFEDQANKLIGIGVMKGLNSYHPLTNEIGRCIAVERLDDNSVIATLLYNGKKYRKKIYIYDPMDRRWYDPVYALQGALDDVYDGRE